MADLEILKGGCMAYGWTILRSHPLPVARNAFNGCYGMYSTRVWLLAEIEIVYAQTAHRGN